MATTSDVSRGMFLRHEGELVQLLEFEHRTPGNLRAFYQAKMRNVRTGRLVEYRFRSGENVEIVRVEVRKLQYLYMDGDNFMVMDTETFDQMPLPKVLFGERAEFLKEGMDVMVSFDGDIALLAELPPIGEYEITYTEPGLRGDTATKTLKAATIETGATIRVPLFIDIGDRIRVDLKTGEYMERAK